MPRVPQYEVSQVESRPLPGVRQSSVASPEFLAGAARSQIQTGQALGQAGAGLGNAAAVMQYRENADMLFRAETALKDDYLKYEEDLRNRKGQQAWGATRDTEKWFAEQEKKRSEGLGNDVQRRLFTQSITKLRQSAMGTVSTYEAGERRRSLEESASASIVGSINTAAANATNWFDKPAPPSVSKDDEGNDMPPAPAGSPITGIKSDILKRVQVIADLNGWGPERKAFEEEKHLTNLHKQVIQNLVDKNPERARQYYEANKAEISGSEYNSIDKVLKVGEVKQAGFLFAERADIRALASEEDRVTAARDFYKDDPAKREAAIGEIKTRAAERETFRRQGESQAADNAWKVIANGGGVGQIPSALWASLNGQDQRHIQDYTDAKVRRAASEAEKDKDDLENLDKVERMIEQGDITDRAGLAKYDAFFSKSTLKTLANKIDKRASVPPTDIRRAFEERKGEKVNVNKMSEGDRAEWMAFQDFILQNVRETRRPEDLDNFADRWFMKGYGRDNSVFANDPDTYGEARAKGRKDFMIETPEAAVANTDEALSILQRAGVAVPKDRKAARDALYTSSALDAERWAAAHSMTSSPELVAAYALLKQNKKPITAANLQYVMQQFTLPAPAGSIPK